LRPGATDTRGVNQILFFNNFLSHL
jgi:hypothetical protein